MDGLVRCASALARSLWKASLDTLPICAQLGRRSVTMASCCSGVAKRLPARAVLHSLRHGRGGSRGDGNHWIAALGGRWALDVRSGKETVAAPLTARGMAGYAGVLAP